MTTTRTENSIKRQSKGFRKTHSSKLHNRINFWGGIWLGTNHSELSLVMLHNFSLKKRISIGLYLAYQKLGYVCTWKLKVFTFASAKIVLMLLSSSIRIQNDLNSPFLMRRCTFIIKMLLNSRPLFLENFTFLMQQQHATSLILIKSSNRGMISRMKLIKHNYFNLISIYRRIWVNFKYLNQV